MQRKLQTFVSQLKPRLTSYLDNNKEKLDIFYLHFIIKAYHELLSLQEKVKLPTKFYRRSFIRQ